MTSLHPGRLRGTGAVSSGPSSFLLLHSTTLLSLRSMTLHCLCPLYALARSTDHPSLSQVSAIHVRRGSHSTHLLPGAGIHSVSSLL